MSNWGTHKKMGDAWYDSGGSTHRKIGDTWYDSDGTIHRKIGSTWYSHNNKASGSGNDFRPWMR